MADESAQSYAPDVVTTYVWDAIKEIPGVADLHRSPLQALGEKVHLERLRPVRLEEHEGQVGNEISGRHEHECCDYRSGKEQVAERPRVQRAGIKDVVGGNRIDKRRE